MATARQFEEAMTLPDQRSPEKFAAEVEKYIERSREYYKKLAAGLCEILCRFAL
jgi:hypothetical protein